MRRLRFIYPVIVIAALMALYWGFLDRVPVLFTVQPGGTDVKVKVDGRLQSPSFRSLESNLYSFSLRHGRHRVVVEKAGHATQEQVVDVRWGDGEKYPVFAPLQKVRRKSARVQPRRPGSSVAGPASSATPLLFPASRPAVTTSMTGWAIGFALRLTRLQ